MFISAEADVYMLSLLSLFSLLRAHLKQYSAHEKEINEN